MIYCSIELEKCCKYLLFIQINKKYLKKKFKLLLYLQYSNLYYIFTVHCRKKMIVIHLKNHENLIFYLLQL